MVLKATTAAYGSGTERMVIILTGKNYCTAWNKFGSGGGGIL
ncbi:unnamed protein product, partial [Arabidopsis lyrata]